MSREREAAVHLRTVWQKHDKQGWRGLRKAASGLFLVLGADPNSAEYAGIYTSEAYFYADRAEKFQGKNFEEENHYYALAAQSLGWARKSCGFETKSADYTAEWWKAYRHKDKKAVEHNLILDHLEQFSFLTEGEGQKYAVECSKALIEAGRKGHDVKNWRLTEDLLEKYFEIFFEAWDRRTLTMREI